MRRRDFIGVICGAALALPCGAAAQQAGKVFLESPVRARRRGICRCIRVQTN